MMARAVSCGWSAGSFIELLSVPAALLVLVLHGQPVLERLEVIDDRGRIHLAPAGQLLHRVLPRLARAERQHLAVLLAGFLAVEDRAFVQRALEARGVAQR